MKKKIEINVADVEAPIEVEVPDPVAEAEQRSERLPREGLIRALPDCEIREAQEGHDGPGTIFGHLAVFNQWSEIRSQREGHFMERMAPGAFQKTITEGR